MTAEDLAPLYARAEALRLPHVELVVGEVPATAPMQSAFGGPFWRPCGASAPVDGDGAPMTFLAQINFAEMPTLPDFPTSGLLQIFVATDDLYGCEFPSTNRRGFTVDWWPDASGGTTAPQTSQGYSPFQADQVRMEGRALGFKAGTMRPSSMDWRLVELEDALAEKEWGDLIDAYGDELTGDHPALHVGGHPDFTQYDVRSADYLADYDKVLIHFGTNEHIMWGDSGEATFLLTAAALRECGFDKVIYYWDCC